MGNLELSLCSLVLHRHAMHLVSYSFPSIFQHFSSDHISSWSFLALRGGGGEWTNKAWYRRSMCLLCPIPFVSPYYKRGVAVYPLSTTPLTTHTTRHTFHPHTLTQNLWEMGFRHVSSNSQFGEGTRYIPSSDGSHGNDFGRAWKRWLDERCWNIALTSHHLVKRGSTKSTHESLLLGSLDDEFKGAQPAQAFQFSVLFCCFLLVRHAETDEKMP